MSVVYTAFGVLIWCLSLQLFDFVALRTVMMIIATICVIVSVAQSVHIVFQGGQGKNGSTVAVCSDFLGYSISCLSPTLSVALSVSLPVFVPVGLCLGQCCCSW